MDHELVARVEAVLRERHGACDASACPLSRIWAEDIQEILDVVAEVEGRSFS